MCSNLAGVSVFRPSVIKYGQRGNMRAQFSAD